MSNAIVSYQTSLMKVCSKCGKEKPCSDFVKNRSRSDGLAHYCKDCAYLARKLWQEKHPESYRASKRKTYWQNPERERERSKQYRENNPEVVGHQNHEYVKNNPQRMHAVNAVNRLVAAGGMPPVASLACVECGGQANDYHHHSYEQKYWLDVVPLCRSCHRLVHTGTLKLEIKR